MRMRWNIGYFGIKDLFTVINLLGGVIGIYFAMQGRIDYAGYAIFAGYLFGDALDGQVARWTNTGNAFGSEFDSAADHIGQGIAPAVVVYKAYELGGHETMGLVLMAALICTASIRQARFATAPFKYSLCYCGLPRTVSGMIALSLPNAHIFFQLQPYRWEAGVVIIATMSVLNLVPIPYMTHKGRRMQWYVKMVVVPFLLAPPLLFFFARPFLYDFLFVCTLGYALTAWIPVLPDERRAFYDEYRRWAAQVARK
jgi:CDP-diacylglycerol---serine O-phosphatidyltransferase